MFSLPSFFPQPGSIGSMIGGPFGGGGDGGGGGGVKQSPFSYTNLLGGLPPQGLSPMMPQPGLPSGYAPPPGGVPFNQSPFLPFGSAFGLGLNFWAPGFGRGPGWPANLWSPPGSAMSPQSAVAPPGGPPGADTGPTAPVLRPSRGALLSVPGGYTLPNRAYAGDVPPVSDRPVIRPPWGAE